MRQKRLVAERAAAQLDPPQRGEGRVVRVPVEEIGKARRSVDKRRPRISLSSRPDEMPAEAAVAGPLLHEVGRCRRRRRMGCGEVEELLFRGHPEVVDADLAGRNSSMKASR